MDTHPEDLLEQRWVRWALYFSFWTGLGLLNVTQSYFILTSQHLEFHFWKTLVIGLADWYMWAALAPVIFYVTRRFPLDQRNWPTSVVVHFCVSILCALLIVATLVPLFFHWMPPQTLGPGSIEGLAGYLKMFEKLFISHLVYYSWIYWAIVGVCYALSYYRKYRERERRTAQLEGQLAQAQLQVLKMQLQPHFLFNTLNTISALVHKDADLADRMIARLGELLRSSLTNAGRQVVPLREELSLVRAYLEIEQARLGPRLRIHMQCDPRAMDGLVPNMAWQPVVENAIRHAIAPRPEGGRLELRCRRVGDQLELEVRDDGPGLPETVNGRAGLREGVGLSTTRARLKQLYGEDYHFRIRNHADGGVVATLAIPFREAWEETLPLSSRAAPVGI